MSLGDLYRKNKLSLAGQLRVNRLMPTRPSNQPVAEWRVYLQFLRGCWEAGESTELETDFFEWFDPSQKPPRWPAWLTESIPLLVRALVDQVHLGRACIYGASQHILKSGVVSQFEFDKKEALV